MPDIIAIDDPSDPRIAPYRAVRERDVAGRGGGFIAEGEVVLRVLGLSRLHRARSLLIAANRIERLADELEPFMGRAPIYAASQAVMDAIVGFHIHRGILALGERGPRPTAAELLAGLPPHATILALFGVANHDNIGGIFRNAAAFGVSAVLLDGACCDPLYRKAIRVSVGGALVVRSRALPRATTRSWSSKRPDSHPSRSARQARHPCRGSRPHREPPCCSAPRARVCPPTSSIAPPVSAFRWRPASIASTSPSPAASSCIT